MTTPKVEPTKFSHSENLGTFVVCDKSSLPQLDVATVGRVLDQVIRSSDEVITALNDQHLQDEITIDRLERKLRRVRQARDDLARKNADLERQVRILQDLIGR